MIDLDELIAALRERAASDSPAHTLMNEAADALEAATRVPGQGEPNDDREVLAKVMDTLAYYHCRAENPKADHPRMGYHAFEEGQREFLRERQREAAEEIVRMIPALAPRVTVPDARDHLHAKCDCVPDLGPAHCHLCTGEGSPVRWEDCEAVREIADVSEPVEVVLTTTDIEGLAHLLVQLSPATQKNSGATIRRLLREINIKEVGQ